MRTAHISVTQFTDASPDNYSICLCWVEYTRSSDALIRMPVHNIGPGHRVIADNFRPVPGVVEN